MRCYDGCPDAELQAKLDDEADAAQELAKSGIRVVYFPMEGKWMAMDENHNARSGFCDTKRAVANAVFGR